MKFFVSFFYNEHDDDERQRTRLMICGTFFSSVSGVFGLFGRFYGTERVLLLMKFIVRNVILYLHLH